MSQLAQAALGNTGRENVMVTNNFITGTIQFGDVSYNINDFLKDLQTSVVNMALSIKDIKERLTKLENRVKVDSA